MCHDGAVPDSLASVDTGSENADATNDWSDDEEVLRKTKLRTMIFEFIAQGYNVALVNGLEWLDTKVPHASLYPEDLLTATAGDDLGPRRQSQNLAPCEVEEWSRCKRFTGTSYFRRKRVDRDKLIST